MENFKFCIFRSWHIVHPQQVLFLLVHWAHFVEDVRNLQTFLLLSLPPRKDQLAQPMLQKSCVPRIQPRLPLPQSDRYHQLLSHVSRRILCVEPIRCHSCFLSYLHATNRVLLPHSFYLRANQSGADTTNTILAERITITSREQDITVFSAIHR